VPEPTVAQRELVERARRGDHDAFAELVGATITRLDAVARLILRDRELARDAVQEALVRAWRDLPGLRDPDRFDAWLHRLTVRSCLDLTRRRRRRVSEVELQPILEIGLPDDTDLFALRDQLDRALARLEPELRAVVVLRFWLDLPVPEAAEALGIPLGTAKSRLHRAISALRRTVDVDEREAEFEGGPIT
jgi:RNA polymerase sigma-70 factor, ECF subfamily